MNAMEDRVRTMLRERTLAAPGLEEIPEGVARRTHRRRRLAWIQIAAGLIGTAVAISILPRLTRSPVVPDTPIDRWPTTTAAGLQFSYPPTWRTMTDMGKVVVFNLEGEMWELEEPLDHPSHRWSLHQAPAGLILFEMRTNFNPLHPMMPPCPGTGPSTEFPLRLDRSSAPTITRSDRFEYRSLPGLTVNGCPIDTAISVWIGPKALPRDVKALERIVASIRPANPNEGWDIHHGKLFSLSNPHALTAQDYPGLRPFGTIVSNVKVPAKHEGQGDSGLGRWEVNRLPRSVTMVLVETFLAPPGKQRTSKVAVPPLRLAALRESKEDGFIVRSEIFVSPRGVDYSVGVVFGPDASARDREIAERILESMSVS